MAEEAEMSLTLSAIEALADAVSSLGNLTKSTPKRKAPAAAKDKAKAKKAKKWGVRYDISILFWGARAHCQVNIISTLYLNRPPKKICFHLQLFVYVSAMGPVLLQPSEFAVRCLQCRTSGCAMAHVGCEHGGLWLWVSFLDLDRHKAYAYKIYGYPTVPKRQGHQGLCGGKS